MASSSPPDRGQWGDWLQDLRARGLEALGPSAAEASLPAAEAAAGDDVPRLRAVLERIGAALEVIGERIDAVERRQERLAEAIREGHESLRARADDVLDEVHALRTATEPHLIAAVQGDREAGDRHAAYREVVGRLRGVVRRLLPHDARVLVVSRGDDDLLRLSGPRAGHFPQDPQGGYAGHHPADDAAALAHLDELAAAGWQFLVLPEPAFWWLDHYAGLRAHLGRSCTAVHHDADTCAIWALHRPGPWVALAALVADIHHRECRFPAILDWETGRDVAALFPECAVFRPLEGGLPALPHIDASVDIVAVPAGDPARLAEARRVATHAVVVVGPTETDGILVEPLPGCRPPPGPPR